MCLGIRSVFVMHPYNRVNQPVLRTGHRQECVQFHDILYRVFRDILYTPARA